MTAATLDLSPNASSQPTLAVAAGRNLAAAGAIFGLANAFQWGVLSGTLHLHPAYLSLVWPIAVAIFIGLINRLKRYGGENALRAARWSRLAIFAQIGVALTLAGISYVAHDWSLMAWMSPIGLLLYAVAWLTASMRGGRFWMAGVGLGAAVAAGGVAMVVGTPVQYLAYACGLFAFAFIPGLTLAFTRAR